MRWSALLPILMAFAAHGQTSVQAPLAPDNGYILGTGDLVEVAVLGQPEFATRAKVRADGAIALPYISSVTAQGLTALDFSHAVTERLKAGGFYAKPIVTVEIAAYASRYVVVLGEVGVPGIVPIDRPYHMSEIIARSGGLRESGADYVVLRHEGAPEHKYPYDKLGTGGIEDDPLVAPNDKLYVPPAPTFYIYGQVNAPGTYSMRGVMTLRKAIVRGGGLRENGNEKRVKITREGVRVAMSLDEPIQAGDIINVGESLF